MHITHRGVDYWTEQTESRAEGWVAIALHSSDGLVQQWRARVVYWDTDGFVLESRQGELPLEIVEALCSHARSAIPVR